jgi:ribonuclease P protein component
VTTPSHPDRAASEAVAGPFPRTARLLKPADFKTVFKNNQASTDALFRVLWRRNEQHGHRLGMAVSRKIDRRAVGRNRIKRVVRESFRRWCAAPVGADRHFDVVVMPRPRAAQTGNADLARSLARLWRQVGSHRDDGGRATRKLN